MDRRVVITGLGFITCIGNDKVSVRDSLLELKSGIREEEFLGNPDLPVKAIGKPQGFEVDSPSWRKWKVPDGYEIDRNLKRGLSPHGMYACCALEQGLKDSGLETGDIQDGDTGLYCASAGSPLLLHENLTLMREARGERGNPLGVLSSIAGTLNFNLGSWYGIRGTNCGYVSACTSGSHAIGYAWDDISLGRQKRAIVIGAEDATAESLLPFSHMRALSTNPIVGKASRPFDRDRNGFVGAGGATVLILEDEETARERGANIYGEIAGWAQMSDGYHPASPHPEGGGLAGAMQRVLDQAQVSPESIDYICAHATSTPAGDKAEAIAIREVFKDWLDTTLVSSPKGLTGHSLSMAGVLELALCCLMMKEGFILGNANLDNIDPDCAHLNLPVETKRQSLSWVLNNSSGFGGINVCNLLKQYDSN